MKPLSKDARQELAEATSLFCAALPGSAAVEYLQGRGLTGKTAQIFRLGYVPEGTEGWERFAGMLSIPNLAANGTVGFKFRDMDPEAKPKYTGRSGEHKRLFNAQALTWPSEEIAICEGEFDAMSVVQAGVPAISVPSGAQSWKAHHTRMLAGFARVYVVADDDDPGRDLQRKLQDAVDNAVPVHLPEGCKDINDALVSGGTSAVLAALGKEEDK